jgi:hypothetical protein
MLENKEGITITKYDETSRIKIDQNLTNFSNLGLRTLSKIIINKISNMW